jgi:tetratricopeptide (TPR) repeat protein
MKRALTAAAAIALTAAACAPRMEPVRPIYRNGEIVPSQGDAIAADARAEWEAERARVLADHDRASEAAFATCAGHVCAAIARGELALGMTRDQVLAATRTGPEAWEQRGGASVTALTGREEIRPSDAVAEVAMVTLEGGRVRSITYREPQGLRLVASAADVGPEARNRARAEALLREGDDLAAAGDFVRALDRYDRADVIAPGPETSLRIARALDKQLRPMESAIRYRLFLHQLELERIRAHGEAYAHWAAAIAEARDRIVVLDRR